MMFFQEVPLFGFLAGCSCKGSEGKGKFDDDDEDTDLVSTSSDGSPISSSGEGSPMFPVRPLWLEQAEEDNRQKDELESDSDDNYSYDDDETDRAERLSEYTRLKQEAAQSRGGRVKIGAFDKELHDLLTSLGEAEEGSVDECILRQEFEAFDTDGNGSLDVEELGMVLEKLGIQVKPYKLMNLIQAADDDGNGMIEWPEFSKIVRLGIRWNSMLKELGSSITKKRGQVLDYQLKQEFNKIDVDGNGSLDADELQQLFSNLNIPCDAAMVAQMVAMADKDQNGTIEWDEFRNMFHVINTVSRMTRPRKVAKAPRRASIAVKNGRPLSRPSCVEWQTIITSVGQQIASKKLPMNDKSLKKEFDRIDTSRDGSLDASELATMFSDMGIQLEQGQIQNLVAMADDDGNDTIEWPEFQRMFEMSMKWHEFLIKLGKSMSSAGPLNDTVLRRQFLMIDTDGSGSIDRHEMKAVFQNLKIKVDDSMVAKLMVLADGDGSEEIEWPEFKRVFKVVQQLADHKQKTAERYR